MLYDGETGERYFTHKEMHQGALAQIEEYAECGYEVYRATDEAGDILFLTGELLGSGVPEGAVLFAASTPAGAYLTLADVLDLHNTLTKLINAQYNVRNN